MNYQEHPNTLKHHNVISILTELACVCLIIASLLYGAEWNKYQAKQNRDYIKDGLTAWYQATEDGSLSSDDLWADLGGAAEPTTDENGNVQYRPIAGGKLESITDENGNLQFYPIGGKLEITTDENGNKYYGYVSGGNIEITTDESGNHYFGTIGGGQFELGTGENSGAIILRPTPDGSTQLGGSSDSASSSHRNLSLYITLQNVVFLISPFLACVLLMLYVLTLYKKDRMKRLLPGVFGLMCLSLLVQIINNLFLALRSAETSSWPTIILSSLPSIVQILLFDALAKQLRKGQIKRKLVVATLIFHLICYAFSLPMLFALLDSDFATLASFLYVVGYLSFTGAWFILAYWNGRPATAPTTIAEAAAEAPSTESPSEESPSGEASSGEASSGEAPEAGPTETPAGTPAEE